MMQTANMATKKSGTSMAANANLVWSRCSLSAVSCNSPAISAALGDRFGLGRGGGRLACRTEEHLVVDFFDFVQDERHGRRTTSDRTGDDVEARAVALTH